MRTAILIAACVIADGLCKANGVFAYYSETTVNAIALVLTLFVLADIIELISGK